MDKQNYTIKDVEIQEIKEKFCEIQHFIEEEFERHELIKRKRIIKSYDVLLRAAYLYIIDSLSFQRISDKMSCIYRVTMSDTAWKKQLTKAAPVFASAAMQCLSRMSTDIPSTETVLGYSNAYALDATVIPAEGVNGTVFRLHTQYSLIENIATNIHITDCHSAESVKHYDIKPGALYVADRAYGKTLQFAYIIDKQADFIFRVSPHCIALFYDSDCKNKIDFEELLQTEKTSVPCYFKVGETVYRIRLIISPIPVEKHNAIEKKTRSRALKKQHTVSDRAIEFSKWIILATSMSEAVTDSDILDTYRLRWQIELFFKRAKSLLHFHKLRRSSASYMRTAVLLWVAVVFFVSALGVALSNYLLLDISSFNLFHLSTSFFS